MSYLMIEQTQSGETWILKSPYVFATGKTKIDAIKMARARVRDAVAMIPLQPEEIPGELREIGRRLREVGGAAAYYAGFKILPPAEAMIKWGESVEAWADSMEREMRK